MIHRQAQKREQAAVRAAVLALGLVAVLAAALPPAAHGGSDERKGTAGANELRIPVGARGSALGGAVVGDATGIEAMFWNPAGLATVNGTEALFSHTQYFAEQKLNYAAIATRSGDIGIFGFSAKVLSIGDVIVTTELAPEGTGEILQPTFSVLGLTYAREFTDRVLFGASMNFVNERILSTSANGIAFDFGFVYVTGWRGLKLGMAMKNFGNSMRFDGEDFNINVVPPNSDPTSSNRTFRSTSSSFEMPSYFTLSGSYDLMTAPEQRLKALGAFQNNNFVGDNLCAGLEWTYRTVFALRGSYMGTLVSETNVAGGDATVKFETGDDLFSGYAIGAGTLVRVGQSRLGVDVAWRPVRHFFDDVVEVGLKLLF